MEIIKKRKKKDEYFVSYMVHGSDKYGIVTNFVIHASSYKYAENKWHKEYGSRGCTAVHIHKTFQSKSFINGFTSAA